MFYVNVKGEHGVLHRIREILFDVPEVRFPVECVIHLLYSRRQNIFRFLSQPKLNQTFIQVRKLFTA